MDLIGLLVSIRLAAAQPATSIHCRLRRTWSTGRVSTLASPSSDIRA